jgi:hypothetical protein
MKNEPSRTVSFRLKAADFQLLAQMSGNGESAGDCAKRLVLAALHDEQNAAVLEELTELKQELLDLRDHLPVVLVALLCDAGKVAKPDAEAFVHEILGD